MRAIVLSGGGNLGAAQVGALRVLVERAVMPEMIVGCSVGALNASFLAREFSTGQVENLAQIWRNITRADIYPGTRIGAIWRFITGKDSLYDNRRFFDYLQRGGMTPALTFGHYLPLKLFITATHLPAGALHVFGDNPHDRILDALMASTALPPMHPPWIVDGEPYTDGGTITPLPLRVALDRGAKEIFALHIVDAGSSNRPNLIRGITNLATTSINTMLRLQAQHDLLLAEVSRKVKLHYIPLHIEETPDALNFDEADRLIEMGAAAAEKFFNAVGSLRPDRALHRWQWLSLWRRESADSETDNLSSADVPVYGPKTAAERVNEPNSKDLQE